MHEKGKKRSACGAKRSLIPGLVHAIARDGDDVSGWTKLGFDMRLEYFPPFISQN